MIRPVFEPESLPIESTGANLPLVAAGRLTPEGLRGNVSVGVRYLDAWLHGTGAAAIDNLMEDVATAEISRSQVWSWVRAGRFGEDDVRREIDLVEAESLEAFLVRAADIGFTQIARGDLGGQENLVPRKPAIANRPADLDFVTVNLGRINVPVT